MYFFVIYLILNLNGYDVPYTVFNSQVEFQTKENCELYVKNNLNIIKNDIHTEVLTTQYELKEILNILCLKLPMNNA